MFNKTKNLLLLLCITSCIYVIRNNYTSPTNLLQSQVTRFLQELRPSVSLCDGVDIVSDVTADDRANADDYRSALSNIRDGNPFIEFIQGPLPSSDFGSEYVVPVIKYTIPWIVFFAISVIACLAYLFTWCCCRHSKSERCKNICFILGIFFLVSVIGASIAGLVVSRGFSKGGHRSICRAALLFEELAYGDGNDNWIGIRPAADQVTVVLDSFDTTVDSLTDLDNDFTEMQARIQPALDAVQSMYDDNRNKRATRPDPDVGGTYAPLYIQNLGPVDDISTATGTLQLEMETKQTIVEEASNAINSAISGLRENRVQYKQDINTGRDYAQLTRDSVDDVIVKVDEFGHDAGRIVKGINDALLGIFITKLIIGAFAILMILIVCIGAKFFNKCIHLSWCALGLIVILTWALAAVVYPFSLIMFEGCEVADRIITDPDFFDTAFNKFVSNSPDANTERARQVVRQCMFEDGEILAVFGLEGKINMFDPIFNALDNTANLTETVQSVPDSIAIPANQQLIQSFRDGTTPDSTQTGEDLVTLNSYIVNNIRQCSQVQDIWVLNSDQCPSGSVYASNYAATFNMGSVTCIGFDVWGDRDINQRYSTTTLPSNVCGDTDAYLSNYVGRFVQSRQDVEGIFDDLQNSLDNVATTNTAFMDSVKAVTQRFDPIRQNTLTVYNALANKDTGLLSNTNCLFIKDSIHSLHDSLCVEAISSLFQTTIVIIVLSFMGLFATFFVFCLTRKFSVERRKDERQIPETYRSPKA